MSAATVVIGLGNRFRHDDGIGPVIAELVGTHRMPGVTAVCVGDTDPTRLMEAWAGAGLAVVVDAARCRPPHPGRIHRLLPGSAVTGTASTHHFSVPDTLRLSAALGTSPGRLVVLAVEAGDLSPGIGLSPRVAEAVPRLLARVLAEIRSAPGVA